MNAAILTSTTQKALKAVYIPASKLPKHLKNLPILHTLKLDTHEGRVRVTCVYFDEKTQEFAANVEYIPAIIEQEFETCIPGRQFKDWINASQLTKEERAKGIRERMEIDYNAAESLLVVKQGNSRASFKCINAQEFPAI